jgi:hypothetical protein
VLSAEKTPTLCAAMPAFVAMTTKWRELQRELPDYYEKIEAGIRKLEQYHVRLTSVPAYMLSICKAFNFLLCHTQTLTFI